MDPLSVSASIIGVLGAAAKVSSVLITFAQNTRAAPKLAQTVLADIKGLSTVLSHLQTYILGNAIPSKSRTSLILVEQVIVTLTECVITFSELEDVLGTSKDMGVLDRMKWAMKESKISDIQRRLQSDKSSLTLMLTILQCQTMEEAESAMARLCDRVEQVLASNQDMGRRLRDIDHDTIHKAASTVMNPRDDASTKSSGTVTPPIHPSGNLPEVIQRNQFGFAFEEDLFASRVYRKPLFSDSGESLITSAARTTSSSILSALSLTDVSNISILAIPIYSHEISNSNRYSFGDFHPAAVNVEQQSTNTRPLKELLKANKWDGFASAVWRRRRSKLTKTDSAEPLPTVLGIPLSESIKYANVAISINVAISLSNAEGESYVYGYIPLYVAKIGVFLKEKGTEVKDLFTVSGSPLRLQKLEAAFNEPPRYGKGLDWSGYTVHDAANILLRFLLRLPEPIIPLPMYEAFQGPVQADEQDSSDTTFANSAIRRYQHQILLLPALSRQLLLYLLDLLAVFASKSESNNLTAKRLATIFQPAILSPVRAGEEFVEEEAYRRLSRDVLTFLIENQDNFLVGMSREARQNLRAKAVNSSIIS